MRKRAYFTREFKLEAVRLLEVNTRGQVYTFHICEMCRPDPHDNQVIMKLVRRLTNNPLKKVTT